MKKIFLPLGILTLVSCGSMDKKTDYVEREPQQVIVDAGAKSKLKLLCRAFVHGTNGKSSQLVGSSVDDSTNILIEPPTPGVIGAKSNLAFFIPVDDLFNKKELNKRFKVKEIPGVELAFSVSALKIVKAFTGPNANVDTGDKGINVQAHYFLNGQEMLSIQGDGIKSEGGFFKTGQNLSTGVWPKRDAGIDALSMSCSISDK